MEIGPIIKALFRSKTRFFLIGLEVALTLAIVINCINMILDTRKTIDSPTGMDEAGIIPEEDISEQVTSGRDQMEDVEVPEGEDRLSVFEDFLDDLDIIEGDQDNDEDNDDNGNDDDKDNDDDDEKAK